MVLIIKIADCRQLFKQGVHALVTKGADKCAKVHIEAPSTMDYLGEDSRKSFTDTLEYLETLDIAYEIDKTVLGDPNYSTHTVFEITDLKTNKIVAAGSRYNLLSKKIGLKKEISAMGAVVKISNPKTVTEIALNKLNKANIFFMQIGFAGKLQALKLIDDLRKESIPLKFRLYKDRLSSQIGSSKKEKTEYVAIIGQKEAMDGTIIFRDKDSKNQLILKTGDDLVKHIKKLK
jgi:histidyl-tRNA synthetase